MWVYEQHICLFVFEPAHACCKHKTLNPTEAVSSLQRRVKQTLNPKYSYSKCIHYLKWVVEGCGGGGRGGVPKLMIQRKVGLVYAVQIPLSSVQQLHLES